MSIRTIPLSAIPAQIVSAVVNEQAFQIEIRASRRQPFFNNDGGWRACRIISTSRQQGKHHAMAILAVNTSVIWVDTQGDDDPRYEGLGSRWILAFEEAVS